MIPTPPVARPSRAYITAQLALVLALLFVLEIEQGMGLPRLLPVIFLGFVLNAALPPSRRLLFFAILSMATDRGST